MADIKIAVDAGHGSKTPGKRTPPLPKAIDIEKDGIIDLQKGMQFREHYANTGVARLLSQLLQSRGFGVVQTGWNDADASDDADIPLASRQRMIKKASCDYCVSIHFNAYGDGKKFNSAKGVSVFIHSLYPADSEKLAQYALEELAKGSLQKNRGIHSARYAMCNCKAMNTKASILCELAFMTNEEEAEQLMASQAFWKESASEIAEAIERYSIYRNRA